MKEIALSYQEMELVIYKIINRYFKYKELKIFTPSPECLYESQQLYYDVYNDAVANEIFTDAEMLKLMRERGEWDDYDENQLNIVLPKHVQYFQKEIYTNFDNKKQLKQIYVPYNKAREGILELSNKRNIYSYLTAEGISAFAKMQYIVEHSTYLGEKPYDWSMYDIKDVISFIYEQYIDDGTLRYIVRHNPWYDIWNISKRNHNLFNVSSVELSEDQKRLMSWSITYDSVYECQDRPKQEIIDSDDALDGWFIIKKEENDRQNTLSAMEEMLGPNKNAKEVFIVANKCEDERGIHMSADEVYKLNDPSTRAIVNSRIKTIQNKGEAQDIDFGDVQRELQIKHNQLAGRN